MNDLQPRRLASAVVLLSLLTGCFFVHGKTEGRRAVCQDSLKEMGLVLKMYAEEHDNALPTRLSELYPNYLDDLRTLACPSTSNAGPFSGMDRRTMPPDEIDAASDYIYISGLRWDLPGDTIVMFDKPGNHPDGRNVLFLDGRVEWQPEG